MPVSLGHQSHLVAFDQSRSQVIGVHLVKLLDFPGK